MVNTSLSPCRKIFNSELNWKNSLTRAFSSPKSAKNVQNSLFLVAARGVQNFKNSGGLPTWCGLNDFRFGLNVKSLLCVMCRGRSLRVGLRALGIRARWKMGVADWLHRTHVSSATTLGGGIRESWLAQAGWFPSATSPTYPTTPTTSLKWVTLLTKGHRHPGKIPYHRHSSLFRFRENILRQLLFRWSNPGLQADRLALTQICA